MSLEDDGGDRCVDVLRGSDGRFFWRECRRDPEDGHGWRHLSGMPRATFESAAAAKTAAQRDVGWMAACTG
jgi:hypothetical protein